MDYQKLYDDTLTEEKELIFDSFSNEDALEIGKKIIERFPEFGRVGIEISVNNHCVFAFYPTGSGANNASWIARKRNSVNYREMSTLRLFALLQLQGKTQEDCNMPFGDFAVCGGGFPITIKGGAVVGSICVSALEHTMDHKLIVTSLRSYFKEKANK